MNKFNHSKKKMIFFGGIGIGALILVVGVIFVTTFLMSPKKRIYKALMNTYGGMDILSEYGEKGGTVTVDADVSGANGDVNIKYLETTDKSSMEKAGKIELSQGGQTVLSSDFAMGQDGEYLSVDDVTDGYVQLGDKSGTAPSGPVEEPQKSGKEDKAGERRQGNPVAGIIGRLWSEAEVTSAGKGSVTNGVKKIKCKKYKAVIKASDINSMLTEMSQAKQSVGDKGQSSVLLLLQEFFHGASMQGGSGGMMPGQDSSGFGSMMPGQDSSGFGGMMPGQDSSGFGGMMPGQGDDQQGGQQSGFPDIKSLMESGVSSDLVLTIYMDKNKVRAFVADVTFADDASTALKVASKNKGVDKVTAETEWTISLASATDEDDIYLDVEALDGKIDINAEAALMKSGQSVLSGTGIIQISTDIDKDELDKVSNVITMGDVDQSKLGAKNQDVRNALSVLRDGQNQNPMMGGSGGQFGGPGMGGSDNYSNYGFGQGGPGMGPGMVPGMGGMMPVMMPGMYPD